MVSVAPIPDGATITADMVSVKRPSPGEGAIPAKHLDEVIGKVARGDIAKDRQILWSQIG